jgi:hypothetical protein
LSTLGKRKDSLSRHCLSFRNNFGYSGTGSNSDSVVNRGVGHDGNRGRNIVDDGRRGSHDRYFGRNNADKLRFKYGSRICQLMSKFPTLKVLTLWRASRQ